MSPRVLYGCCTNSWDRTAQYVAPRVRDRDLMVLWNQTSLSAAYNTMLGWAAQKHADMLVLLHDDLELTDPAGEEKLLAAVTEPDVAVVGVAGGRDVRSLAWWNHETVGHQMIDSGMLDFGPRSGDVDSLEGSLLAFSPWSMQHLSFDETFSGFHGYDHIGLEARRHNKRVVVADVDTHHHTQLGFSSPESQAAWFRADEMFRKKFGL